MGIINHASFGHNDLSIEKTEKLYQGFLHIDRVSLRHRMFERPDYSPLFTRELVHRKPAAGVLLYNDQQQKFALIEQFRVGAIHDTHSPWQLEIIAGVLDGDETPESCIRRESLEESGCVLDTVEHLFSFYPSVGACDEIFHLYSASILLPEQGGVFGQPDENENIKLHIIEYRHLNDLLQHQRLANAPVIMALQWLKQHILMLGTLQQGE